MWYDNHPHLSFDSCTLSHSVLVLLSQLAELASEVDIDLEVEITLVSIVGFHPEDPVDFLSFLTRDVVLEVKDSLFPVGVRSLRGGGESDSLVTLRKLDVKEGYQGLRKNKLSQLER